MHASVDVIIDDKLDDRRKMKTAREHEKRHRKKTSDLSDVAFRGIKSEIFDRMHFNAMHLHNRRNSRARAHST